MKAVVDDECDPEIDMCLGSGRKHCGKNKMVVTSIFSFLYNVFRRCLGWGR